MKKQNVKLARIELAPLDDGRRLVENLLVWLSKQEPLTKVSIATVYRDSESV